MSDNHTHFSILNKEYIERDEHAEVEDVDVVLDSHLSSSKQRTVFDLRTAQLFLWCVSSRMIV